MDRSFIDLLARAVAGDHDAIEEILKMYMPLFNRHSRINGYLDEDCRQYILLRVAVSISKFII
ncbi:MAG: helix-turn-helix domain-containing protein [Clostridiales bacterium]|nr:helix-turn-helix domain-containing protein [Clostridiales bacterium]